MAIKNEPHERFSAFGQRLMGLMVESKHDTSPRLATALYDAKLVSVKTKDSSYDGDDGSEKRKNAIGSIVKKIRAHLHSNSESGVQGEFIIAYSKFFGCSTDYLLGLTDIKTAEIDIRKICEKTGLSEQAVLLLVNEDENEISKDLWRECWSQLIESNLFDSLPDDYLNLLKEFSRHLCLDGEIQGKQWALKNLSFDETHTAMINGQIKTLVENSQRRKSAFYGIMAKIARDVSNTYERIVDSRFSTVKTDTLNREMQALRRFAEEGKMIDDDDYLRFNIHKDL